MIFSKGLKIEFEIAVNWRSTVYDNLFKLKYWKTYIVAHFVLTINIIKIKSPPNIYVLKYM